MAAGNVFTIDIDVRFRDLDAMGHVNNAVMFTYFEQGRTAFFANQRTESDPWGFNFILARISCDYLRPVTLQDRPALRMWIGDIGTKSFRAVYELVDRHAPETVFARGESVQVCYDYAEGRSMAVPDTLQRHLVRYLHAE